MKKILTPRYWPGMNDKGYLEFYKWMLAVSTALGVDPPATLTEVAETSLSPVLSKIRDNESKIRDIESTAQSIKRDIKELARKVDDLERSL